MITEKAASIKEQEIQDCANTLITIVKESYKTGNAIHKVEKDLFEKLLEMGHTALGLLIELCGSGDVGPSVCLADEREVKRLPAPRVKPYLSILIHASSYVWKAVQALNPHDTIKDQIPIVKGYVEKILCGDVHAVIRGLRWKGTHNGLAGERLKQLEQVCFYFENNAQRMRYSEYLAAGYPIASGVIEGACRHVVVDRMEGLGMRWVIAGAQSMLNLRCIHISDHWNHFIDYHIDCEQKEIYPVKAANDHSFITMRMAC